MAGKRPRSGFTENDDKQLIAYIAINNPHTNGRLGNKLYQVLEDNDNDRWPWSIHHSWQSWRERYKKNQEYFDYHIKKYIRKMKEHKPLKSTGHQKTANLKAASPKLKSSPKAESSKLSVEQKAQIASSRQKKHVSKESDPPNSNTVDANERASTLGKTNFERIETTKPEEKDSVDEKEDGQGGISDETMRELFGTLDEDDDETGSPILPILENLASRISPAPQGQLFLDIDDISDPVHERSNDETKDSKFGLRKPSAIPTQSPPVASASIANRAKRTLHKFQHGKPVKRKTDDDFFVTPPRLPSPAIVPIKRDLTTIVDGPFRTTLKRSNEHIDAMEYNSEWPPKRKRKLNDKESQDVDALRKPLEAESQLRSRKYPVNFVTSSSRVKPPAFGKITSALISDLARGGSESPLPRALATSNAITAPSESKQTLPRIAKLTTDAGSTYPVIPDGGENFLPAERSLRILASEGGDTRTTYTTLHHSPAQPSFNADPFTSKPTSTKSAGKVRDNPFVNESKAPRRIDLHRETLAKRLRKSVSRPSSALSSHYSMSLNSKDNLRRTSHSLRQSLSGLDIPDEVKDFTVAAAEELSITISTLAQQYGVSTEVAMKTYMNTRNIDKTKFVLQQFYQCLSAFEKDLYTRMPNLRNDYNKEESESEEEILKGLIPRQPQSPGYQSNVLKTFEVNQSERRPTTLPRKNNRPGLSIRPLQYDDQLSDYSPPNSSRAGQFARLVREGRKDEALAREKRRASGFHVPMTQVEQHSESQFTNSSPSPKSRNTPGALNSQDQVGTFDCDEDDDMYVRSDDENEQIQDASNQADSAELLDRNDREDSGFVSQSQDPEVDSKKMTNLNEVDNAVLKPDGADTPLAQEHRMLALNVNSNNAQSMRTFEAANDPHFLRRISLKWVEEYLDVKSEG